MDDLKECLRCGGELERGSLLGQHVYINWLPEGEESGPTMLGQEHLAKGSLSRGPRLPAARCTSCGLGYFERQMESD